MNSEILHQIKQSAKEMLPEIIKIRRHLHMHPELSFQEKKTSAWLCSKLDELRIPYNNGWAGTGIVAEIKSNLSDHVIALRADMDALPIQEANDVEYASLNNGIMHACGHDVHMASLLGAAMILNKIKSELPYSIR
ncbi:MAG: M20/M25/M40 family metallo-hydrolase, partial [Saprospiraceae bacterium]